VGSLIVPSLRCNAMVYGYKLSQLDYEFMVQFTYMPTTLCRAKSLGRIFSTSVDCEGKNFA
jgi:hypothetical protein